MIWMLHAGRAILVASGLYFVAVLVAVHPPFLTYGAVRTEAAAIAVSKPAFGDPNLFFLRPDHPWQAWLDCKGLFDQCRWTAGYFHCPILEVLIEKRCDVVAYTIVDEDSGYVRERRFYGGE